MKPTFEITIQRCLEFDVFPVVVEFSVPGQALAFRTEGRLTLGAVELEELGTRSKSTDYGEFLGKALFADGILRAFDRAVAQSSGPMNVLLAIEAPELRVLHWEWLCISVDGVYRPIVQDQRFPFCLYQPSQVDRRFPPFGRRDLRMLVVVSSPQGLEKYNLESFDEARALETVTASVANNIPYEVLASREDLPGRVGPPSLAAICERLTAQRFTLLHVIAHGRLNREGETIVYLGNEAGAVQAVSTKELLGRLAQLAALPHFVFLAVCESAKPEAEAALGGLGQRLVRELGIPAVLAMTRKVSHFMAYELARRLYPRLFEHGEIERALVEACAGLIGQADVSVPALYSRFGGRPLFSDDLAGRELTVAEITFGMDRLFELFPDRAPVLLPRLGSLINNVRVLLGLPPRGQLQPATLEPIQESAGPRLLAGGISDLAALSPEAKLEYQRNLAELEALSMQVLDLSFAALALGRKVPTYSTECPFPGMRAFGPNDQRYFFGREALIETLLKRLKNYPFLAVLGASGSGKSSVVRAGLLPRLLQDTPALHVLTTTPSTDPYAQLDAALESAGLREGPKPGQATILFIDQFEELFTLCAPEKRLPFLQRLLKLLPNTQVVLTMRADFWGECAEYAELRRLMQEHQELVPAMNGHELRSAIEQQARVAGLRFEPNLCEKIVEHVQSEPGAMPLLQHALMKLWERRRGTWLVTTEYEALGGVQRAIAETADSIYNGLSAEDRVRMRTVFVRLTRVDDAATAGETRRDTRQRVVQAELIPAGVDAAPYVALIGRLADARLLVTNISPATQQEEVEVVHEALIRNWPRLTAWLEEQRDSLALREALTKAAREWKKKQRSAQWLLHSGTRLRECRALLQRFPGLFNQAEQEYLAACAAKAKRTRLGGLTVGMALLASAAGSSLLSIKHQREQHLGTKQLRQEQQAKQWEQNKQAGSLATLLSMEAGARLRPLSQGILAIAPYLRQHLQPPAATRSGLRDALAVAAFVRPLLSAHVGAVTGAVLSPDGTVVATVGTDRELRLFNASSGALLRAIAGDRTVAHAVVFTPQGERILTGSSDGAVRVYERNSGQLLQTLGQFDEPILALALTADGSQLATGTRAGLIRIYELATGKVVARLAGHQGAVLALAYGADGRRLVSGGKDGTLRFWDAQLRHPHARVVQAHRGAVTALAIGQRSAIVFSGGEDRLVNKWRLADGVELNDSLEVESAVSALAVSRDERVAVGNTDGVITVWRFGVRTPLWVLKDDALGKVASAVSALSFAADSVRLAEGGTDGIVRLWNLPREPVVMHLRDHDAPTTVVEFSADARRLLTGAADHTLQLHDVASGALLREFRDLDASVIAAAFAPTGEIVALTRRGTALRYQESTGELLSKQQFNAAHLGNVQLDSTAHRAVVTIDPDVQVWDLTTGAVLHNFPHQYRALAVAISANDQEIATGCADEHIRIWNAASGALLRTLAAPGGPLFALRFSPDGKLLLSGGSEQRPRVWNLNTGHSVELPAVGSYKQVALRFSPQGDHALVASSNGAVGLWDIASLEPLFYLQTGHQLLRTATVSADGNWVLSAGNDGSVRLFLIDPDQIWRRSCAILMASLRSEDARREEWEQARAACAATKAPK